MYVVKRVIFFFAVNACNQKIVTLCNLFCGKSCKPVLILTQEEIARRGNFLPAFTAKKNYTTWQFSLHAFTAAKKITQRDNFFFYTCVPQKNCTSLPQKNSQFY